MYHKEFKRIVSSSIVVMALAILLSLSGGITQAISVTGLSITNTVVGASCDTSEWIITLSLRATNNDEGSGFDRVSMIATDANGIAISADGNGFPVGATRTQITNIRPGNIINNITASPIVIVVYDTVQRVPAGSNTQAIYDATIAQGAPILTTIIYDPSVDVPSCPAPASASTIPLPAFNDGRINDYDVAAPIAVYPHDINGEIGLVIYDTNGVELLVISPQQIIATPENPDTNLLIAQANGVSLYRLAGGLWQINAPQYNGKTYVMIFPELFHSGGYESHEIDN